MLEIKCKRSSRARRSGVFSGRFLFVALTQQTRFQLHRAHPSCQLPTDSLLNWSSSHLPSFPVYKEARQAAAAAPQKQGNEIRRRKLRRGCKQSLLLKRLACLLLEQQFHRNWEENVNTAVKDLSRRKRMFHPPPVFLGQLTCTTLRYLTDSSLNRRPIGAS